MLTSKEFGVFRTEVEQALQEIGKKYNVNIKGGKIKYSSNSFNLDLQVNKKEINGKSFEQAEFEKYCMLYDFKPEDYRKEFIVKGKTFYITGFALRASKMPILAVNSKGEGYKFTEETIKRLMAG
jgi:hypothetical protein